VRTKARKPRPGPLSGEDLRDLHRAVEELQSQPERRYLTDDTSKSVPEDLVLINAAVNKLKHRLGRRLKGWAVKDLRGATATGRIVRLLESGGQAADDEVELWLDVQGWGANITVRIEVE